MATLELERTRVLTAEEEAQKHNAMIAERYRRLQDAEADQFAESTHTESYRADDTIRASVLAPEAPVYTAPATVEAPALEQTPQVTEYVRARIDSPVFTTEKFNGLKGDEAVASVVAPAPVAPMPVEIYAPTQAAAVSTEAQYSLSRMAKAVLAAFVATVIVMLTLICVNTQLIRMKSARIQNLEQQKEQLTEELAEIQQRIETAQSEETIRQYALSHGMILGNN